MHLRIYLFAPAATDVSNDTMNSSQHNQASTIRSGLERLEPYPPPWFRYLRRTSPIRVVYHIGPHSFPHWLFVMLLPLVHSASIQRFSLAHEILQYHAGTRISQAYASIEEIGFSLSLKHDRARPTKAKQHAMGCVWYVLLWSMSCGLNIGARHNLVRHAGF